MIIRKIRSAVKKIISKATTVWISFKVYLLEENIVLGKNVVIGRGCVIKTTDGGIITIGDNVSIEGNCHIYAQYGEIIIGKNGFIGFGSQIVAKKSIKIGNDSLISAYSIIRDANYGIIKSTTIASQAHDVKEIVIEDDVCLGAHSVVTSGTTIHKGALVGANTVVTKDVEAYTVMGGVPARFIKMRID